MRSPFPPGCATRFRALEVLGSGGFGSVYLAEQIELGREVAVKILHTEALQNEDHVGRFIQEARATSLLDHPGIVKLIDFGVDRGQPWLVYELIRGPSLGRRVLDGPLAWQEAAVFVRQAAEALGFAHERGIIHRDVKPDNLLVDDSGVLKVIDFGIAKWNSRQMVRTEAGLVLGTPEYMSPEQLRGEPPTAQFDLYALGITFFQLLTGRLPFLAGNTMGMVEHQLRTLAPRPGSLVSGIPGPIDELVVSCLAKNAGDRPGGMAELARELRDVETVQGPPDGRPARGSAPHPAGRSLADTRASPRPPSTLLEGRPGPAPGRERGRAWLWAGAVLLGAALAGLTWSGLAGSGTAVVLGPVGTAVTGAPVGSGTPAGPAGLSPGDIAALIQDVTAFRARVHSLRSHIASAQEPRHHSDLFGAGDLSAVPPDQAATVYRDLEGLGHELVALIGRSTPSGDHEGWLHLLRASDDFMGCFGAMQGTIQASGAAENLHEITLERFRTGVQTRRCEPGTLGAWYLDAVREHIRMVQSNASGDLEGYYAALSSHVEAVRSLQRTLARRPVAFQEPGVDLVLRTFVAKTLMHESGKIGNKMVLQKASQEIEPACLEALDGLLALLEPVLRDPATWNGTPERLYELCHLAVGGLREVTDRRWPAGESPRLEAMAWSLGRLEVLSKELTPPGPGARSELEKGLQKIRKGIERARRRT